MENINNIIDFIVSLVSSDGWSNFGQGLGSLLTSAAALLALYVGNKSLKRMMLGESIKMKMADFQQSNSNVAKSAMKTLDDLINDETEDGPASLEDLERHLDLAKRLHKRSYGSADVSQTFSFLAMRMLDYCYKNYGKGSPLISYAQLNSFMTIIAERVFNASSNAVIAPDQIKVLPLHRPQRKYKKDIAESRAKRIQGLDSGIDLRPNSSIVCGFYEIYRRHFPEAKYLSALTYLLRSNDFVKISMEANKVFSPAVIKSPEENPLGAVKELWITGFKTSTQIIPERKEFVTFFYMSRDYNYKFVHNIKTIEDITKEFSPVDSKVKLNKLFESATLSKSDDEILIIKIPREKCKSGFLNRF
ncbi:hypothetical protein [Alcanivorax hongdengensis]|uniref:hypothetical protein n=1 Tax=Alcanivorax hongdengensis TaxID=519051 RepID=UPI0002DE8BFB|nr:hypothetical protein [Alcanivorax hongdengensis]